MPAIVASSGLDFSSLPSIVDLGRELHSSRWSRTEASALIFVCGATREDSLRDQYIRYAAEHHTEFSFFRAEAILNGLEGKADLLTLEDQLADYSDCLLIFCESESAYAELGAFSLKKQLAEKTLVVNDRKFKNSTSFINLGPLAKLAKHSAFGESIWINPKQLLFDVDRISDRLRRIGKGRRNLIRTSFPKGLAVTGTEKRNRMVLINDLIRALCPISRKELIKTLESLQASSLPDLSIDVNLLLNLKLTRLDSGFMRPAISDAGFSYRSHHNLFERIRIESFRFIRRQDPSRLQSQ